MDEIILTPEAASRSALLFLFMLLMVCPAEWLHRRWGWGWMLLLFYLTTSMLFSYLLRYLF